MAVTKTAIQGKEAFVLGYIPLFALLAFLVFIVLIFLLVKTADRREEKSIQKDREKFIANIAASDPAFRQVLEAVRRTNPTYAVVTPEGVELFFSQRVMAVAYREHKVPNPGSHISPTKTVRDEIGYVLPEGGPYNLARVGGRRTNLWNELRPDDGSATVKLSFADMYHAELATIVAGNGMTVSEVSVFGEMLARELGGSYVFHQFWWSDETCYSSGTAGEDITGALVYGNRVEFSVGGGTDGSEWSHIDTAYIARVDVEHNVPTDRYYMRDVVVPKVFGYQVDWGANGIPDPYCGA